MEKACFKRNRRVPAARPTGQRIIAGVWLCVAAVSFAAGCEPASEQYGQLVVTFQTDMALPSQIDNVRVQVSRRGSVLFMNAYPIGGSRNDNPMPGSLALVAEDNPEPITISVAGSLEGEWRTYREAVTTIPRARVAELRMPLQWLCNDSAQPQVVSEPDGTGGQVSRVVKVCPDGLTCKAGECVSNETDSETLPDFEPERLYGGAKEPEDGTCFDVLACMASGVTAVPDATCAIERPLGDNINVALRVAGGGICREGADSTTCFVPLDGEDPEGWTTTADGGRIQLPEEVCRRLAERKVLAVQTSTACPMKSASLTPCGAWSAVPDTQAVMPDPASAPPSWPSPEVLIRLPTSNAKACCPLMSEAGKLYTCMCSAEQGLEEATVYIVDAESVSREEIALQVTPTFAASVYEQTLYWAEYGSLMRLPLQPGARPTELFRQTGLYTDARLLTDVGGIHVMASGLSPQGNDTSPPVNLMHFTYEGALTGMEPLGTRAVHQIAQDGTAFYAGVHLDDVLPSGQAFERVSSVVRIDKAMRQVTTLLGSAPVTITDPAHNGYLGVVADGTDLFAVFEGPPGAAGTEHLQIGRVAMASSAQPGELDVVYDVEVPAGRHLTSLRLIGALDGAVIFARDEYVEGGGLRSSSLLVLPAGATGPRFIADFVGDLPLQGIGVNNDRVFWMNQFGRIFALSREALAP